MRLASPIPVRLTEAQKARYEDEAGAAGKTLSLYIRERLEAQDETRQELAKLRRAVERLTNPSAERQERETDGNQLADRDGHGMLLEILLSLRAIGGNKVSSVVQKEVERTGNKVWRNET